MKKLAISLFALAAMASTAMAGEPLTKSQMDEVTAGGLQLNINVTRQRAEAASAAVGGCAFFCKRSGNAVSVASASNYNQTGQANID